MGKIIGGSAHTMFLMNDGTVKGCGYNTQGQLGIGNTTQQTSIVNIPISNVKEVVCGGYHTMFLLNDGTVKGCGRNSEGQLGIGNITNQLNIVNIPISNVKEVICGGNHTIFLMNDGTVRGCGANNYGQLGIGNTTNQTSIVNIPNISNVKDIICGNNHTMFLLNDGTVKGCGRNLEGQLGIGNTTQQNSIVNIPNISNVKEVICGGYHTMFLLNDGTVRGCGFNALGQLGIGNTTQQNSIVNIPISNVKDIACGNHTMFLLNDGTVKGCGNNVYGQLGIGNTTSPQTSIVNIPINNVNKIICGDDHTMFLLNDVTVKGCGYNTQGQLGIGNTTQQISIVNIPLDFIVKYFLLKNSNKVYGDLNSNLRVFNNLNITNQTLIDYGFKGVGILNSSNTKYIRSLSKENNIFKGNIRFSNNVKVTSMDNIEGFKCIIKSNNKFYTHTNGSLSELQILEASITDTLINSMGFDSNTLSQLSNIDIMDIEIFAASSVPETEYLNLVVNTQSFIPINTIGEVDKNIEVYMALETESLKEFTLETSIEKYNSIKYQLSKDGINWVGYTGFSWSSDKYMSKAEVEALTTSDLKKYFGESIYIEDLKIKVYFNKEVDTLEDVFMKTLSVEYTPNQGPIILNPIITPDSVHAEFAMLKGTLKDLEGDSIEYRVLIKKAGDVDYSVVNDWLAVSNNHNINRGYNQPYFNLGTNNIKIEARDSRGVITSWIGNLVMTNEKPVFNFTYNEFGLEGTINDPNIDNVAIRILIDDVEVQPWTAFFSVPARYSYEWDTKYTPIGQTCNVKVQIKDTFEDTTEYTFSVVGKYKGLLFVNKDGQYFTTDKGSILRMLDFKRLIAGECTPAEKLTLINQSNYNISDIDIIADKGNLPDIATVEFSLSQEPFTPLNKINISEVMAKDATRDVFVRVNSTLGRGVASGEFDIKVSGKIVR